MNISFPWRSRLRSNGQKKIPSVKSEGIGILIEDHTSDLFLPESDNEVETRYELAPSMKSVSKVKSQKKIQMTNDQ